MSTSAENDYQDYIDADSLAKFNDEYSTNNKRIADINLYYSKKYTAQKNILIHIIIIVLILIFFSFLGKFIPDNIANTAIIITSVIGIIKVFMLIWDLITRNPNNFDEYNFLTGTKYSTSGDSQISNLTYGIENVNNTDYYWNNWISSSYNNFDSVTTDDTWCDANNELELSNICFTSEKVPVDYEESVDPFQQFKNCANTISCNDALQSIAKTKYSNVYDYDWYNNLVTIQNSVDSNGNKILEDKYWNSKFSTSDYCNTVCSTDDYSAQTKCTFLCKGGNNGLIATAIDGNFYTYDTCDSGSNFADTKSVLSTQSWYNTDAKGSTIKDKIISDNSTAQNSWSAGNTISDSKFGIDTPDWTGARTQHDLYTYCKLNCAYDMDDCYNSNINDNLENINSKCSEQCSIVIPNHVIPGLDNNGLPNNDGTPASILDDDSVPLSDHTTLYTTWNEYRENY